MAKARITLLPVGKHRVKDKTLDATADRIRKWVDTFKAQKAKDILIPVPWHHNPDALPVSKVAAKNSGFHLSQMNAGYLDDVGFDEATKKMWVDVDVPGCELDAAGNLTAWTRLPDSKTEVKTAIREVSGYFANDWMDGDGTHWPDSLAHVALCVRPVVHGQGGFQPVPEEKGVCLSTSTWVSDGLELATKEGNDAFPPKKKKEDEEDLEAVDGEDDEGGEIEPPPAAAAEQEIGADYFAEAMATLQKLGLHLPEDTMPENLAERIAVAGHALVRSKGAAAAGADTVAGNQTATGGGTAQPEPPPMMLSTIDAMLSTATDPFVKQLLAEKRARHAADQEQVRQTHLKTIERLVKLEAMPVVDAERLRAQVGGYQLSTNADGQPLDDNLDVELSIWTKVFKLSPLAKKAHVARGKPAPGRPDANGVTDAQIEEVAKERAKKVSLTPTIF